MTGCQPPPLMGRFASVTTTNINVTTTNMSKKNGGGLRPPEYTRPTPPARPVSAISAYIE